MNLLRVLPFRRPGVAPWWAMLLGCLALAGCGSPRHAALSPDNIKPYDRIELRPGDTIRVVFPGAPGLNTAQQIRRDGKISLDQGAELVAEGKSPGALEHEILRLYEDRLVTKEVVVTVESSAYPVYISGAVLRPGKILTAQPITVVEAIMEAGGFLEDRAKSKAVIVTRDDNGTTTSFLLDVQAMIEGRSSVRFYLRPMDVVHVPSKLQLW